MIRSSERRVALAVGVLAAVARWLTSRGRQVYTLWPDEPAQLAIARFVGRHGEHWNMWNHSTWRPGYGTVLGLVSWFSDHPVTIYQTGLMLNAALGGTATVCAFLLARRLVDLPPVALGAVTLLVMLSPTLLFTTNFLWSESLAQAIYLATLLALLRFWDHPTLGRGVVAGVLAVAGFGTHSRLLPLVIIGIVLIGVAAGRHRLRWSAAATAALATVGAFLLVSWYSEWVIGQLWNDPLARNSYGGVLSQVGKVRLVLIALVGQAWYQLVATVGLIALGMAALVGGARRGATDARIVLVAVTSLVGLSVVFMTDRWRSDQIVYGRYNDLALIPVMIVAVASLVTTARLGSLARRWAVAAVLMAVCGLLLHLTRHDQLAARDSVRHMILGLLGFMGRPQGIDVLPITLAALILGGLVIGLTMVARNFGPNWARYSGLVLVAVLVAVGFWRTAPIVDRTRNGWRTSESLGLVDESVLGLSTRVDFVLPTGSSQTSRMMSYQFYLPEHRFEVVTAPDLSGARTRLVFAPSDHQDLATSGATAVWTDPRRPVTLWVVPEP